MRVFRELEVELTKTGVRFSIEIAASPEELAAIRRYSEAWGWLPRESLSHEKLVENLAEEVDYWADTSPQKAACICLLGALARYGSWCESDSEFTELDAMAELFCNCSLTKEQESEFRVAVELAFKGRLEEARAKVHAGAALAGWDRL